MIAAYSTPAFLAFSCQAAVFLWHKPTMNEALLGMTGYAPCIESDKAEQEGCGSAL